MFLGSCVLLSFVLCLAGAATKPHIIIILADDLGWNDLSFHGSDQILTPNIDALAYNGVILNQHYVLPICTPSRSAFMTGMYPIHTGMQGIPILTSEARGLPKGKILPEYLRDLGYATKAIGKWHLGYYHEDFLPRNRGFDSHLGYWNGFISYYDYIIQQDGKDNRDYNGFDMRRNETAAFDLIGTYATDMFTNEAVKTIRQHDKKVPMFMYLSHLAVHAGNKGKLLEAPQEWIDRFKYIADPNRRTYAAMVAKMDESVGKVVAALGDADMLQNSIIIFMSDNGAPTIGIYPNWGSNYPFRGIKETLWEGGVRGAALIWSPLIKRTPRVSSDLIHVTDWLPTLFAAAGGSPYNLPKMDGVNQWPTIAQGQPSERRQLLLNIDEVQQSAALRINSAKYNWKLVVGTIQNGTYDDYFGEGTNSALEKNPPYDPNRVAQSRTHKTLELLSKRHRTPFPSPTYTMQALRKQATVKCDYPVFNPKRCNPIEGPDQICLYDLRSDPCELNNLTPFYPNVARYMFKELVQYRKAVVPQLNRPSEIELADPAYFNNTWSVWYDSNGIPLVRLNPALAAGGGSLGDSNETFL